MSGIDAFVLAEGVDLVDHEGEERGDDDGDTRAEEQGGELIADRLAGAGGEEDKGGAMVVDNVVDDFFLRRAEVLEAEGVAEDGVHP